MKILQNNFLCRLNNYVNCFAGMLKCILFFFVVSLFASCEKDFDIGIKANQSQLVVEGYINNELPEYNYVVLSRSMDYYNPDFQSTAVTGALVTITEGSLINDNSYSWDPDTKVQLIEANLPQIPSNFRQGVYFDPRLVTDSSNALKGVAGKHYLLEIEAEGKYYSAIASLLPAVLLDSLTCGYSFADTDDDNKEKARITVHYQDPDTLGNAQLFYWRHKNNRTHFGWGGMSSNWRTNGKDDLTNGEYMRITHNNAFDLGDTVDYYLSSVTRDVYDFWESFRNARNNDGPFSTPVTILNKINGVNVTGCFSGMSISRKTTIVYK